MVSLSGPGEDDDEAPPVSWARGGREIMLLLRDEAEERMAWEFPRRFSGGLIVDDRIEEEEGCRRCVAGTK